MAGRLARVALRRAVVAAAFGLMVATLVGPEVLVPVLALVALVYWMHPLVAALGGREGAPDAGLPFVIVVNSAVVLLVQVLLFAAGIGAF